MVMVLFPQHLKFTFLCPCLNVIYFAAAAGEEMFFALGTDMHFWGGVGLVRAGMMGLVWSMALTLSVKQMQLNL